MRGTSPGQESGELAALVCANPVVTLVGPSGRGESSLAMAADEPSPPRRITM